MTIDYKALAGRIEAMARSYEDRAAAFRMADAMMAQEAAR